MYLVCNEPHPCRNVQKIKQDGMGIYKKKEKNSNLVISQLIDLIYLVRVFSS